MMARLDPNRNYITYNRITSNGVLYKHVMPQLDKAIGEDGLHGKSRRDILQFLVDRKFFRCKL